MILGQESIDVYLGLDVGKTATTPWPGTRPAKSSTTKHYRRTKPKSWDIIIGLTVHGKVVMVVDQPATIGALPVTVARAAGAAVRYLPGLAMRRIADLHPGKAKTDARDAAIIAEAARSIPYTLRSVELDDETLAELGVLCGFDDDLASQITATLNRIRGLLTQAILPWNGHWALIWTTRPLRISSPVIRPQRH